jgi:hypothetical protein
MVSLVYVAQINVRLKWNRLWKSSTSIWCEGSQMEKDSRSSWSSFSGCGNTGLAKYIKNYWPPLEVTLLWRLGPVPGCSFWIRWHKLRRHFATWHPPHRFGRALSPVPTRLSFRQCAYAFTTLQCLCLCYNCERDPYPRSWLEKNHSTMGAS